MNPLELCRARSDLLLLFKVVRGICCIPSISIKFSPKCDYRIVINRIKTKGSKRIFVHRTFMLWNKVIRNNSFTKCSLTQFKKFIFSQNLTPHLEGRAFKTS